MKTLEIGSVSSGTMRLEDLIPTFLDATDELREELAPEDIESINIIKNAMKKEGYFESEDAQYDLEWLFELLNSLCPPYCYFGSHPGDGADYGVWVEDDLEEVFEWPIVNDLSEIAAEYEGEVLHRKDDYTYALYEKKGGVFELIWEI